MSSSLFATVRATVGIMTVKSIAKQNNQKSKHQNWCLDQTLEYGVVSTEKGTSSGLGGFVSASGTGGTSSGTSVGGIVEGTIDLTSEVASTSGLTASAHRTLTSTEMRW
jgi:hypothetical protein